ncbi:MAG: serine hydrolase domain-containing protein [Bacteroidia bacterium]
MIHLNKFIIVILVLVSGVYCSNTSSEKKINSVFNKPQTPPIYEFDSAFSPEKARLIDNFFQNRYNLGQFSGAVLYYDSGRYYTNSYGYANGKLRTKLNETLPFQIASASKTLTAYAVLSLIDQKKLNLSTYVYQILDGFPYKQITVAQLLSHKSGIPNYMNFAETYCKTKYRHLTNNDVLWMLKRYRPRLEFNPESRYKYSNTNYVLLALIIEQLTALPFERYLEDSVFKVIGMKDSYIFTPSMSLKNQLVQGHNGAYNIFPYNYQNGTMGDKGVYTTVFDMLKFDQALRKNLLISPSTLNNACTPHTPCRPTKDYYGYGWRIRYYDNHDTIIYHNGWWQGFKSYFIRWKNKDKCIIVFANTVRGGFIKQDDMMSLMEGIKPKAVTSGSSED